MIGFKTKFDSIAIDFKIPVTELTAATLWPPRPGSDKEVAKRLRREILTSVALAVFASQQHLQAVSEHDGRRRRVSLWRKDLRKE